MAKENKKAALSLEERLDAALVPNWDQPYKVPANWCWTTVKTLCTLINGRAFKPTDWSEIGLPIVRIQNLNNPEAEYNYYSGNVDPAHMLKGQELLFAWSGTPGTSFGAHIWWGNEAVLNQHIFKVLFDEDCVDKTYLKYAINQQLEWLISVAHGGAGLQHVTKGVFESTPIPLPPYAEQQRIVDRIESLFAKLDEAKGKAQEVVDGFEDRKAAILHKAFTGELTAEWRKQRGITLSTWKHVVMQDVCERITCGKTPKEFISAEGDIPFLKVYNIVDNKVDFESNPQFIPEIIHKGKLASSILKPNDVIMNIVGPPLRKIAIVPGTYEEWNMNQAIVRFRPKDGLNCRFLYYSLINPETLDDVVNATRGVVGQANISVSQSRNLEIELPLQEEQKEIVRVLDAILTREKAAKEDAEQVIDQIDTMKKSILARAFRGELGTNDPTDENAVELLKETLNIEKTPTKRAKAITIPKELSANLKTELEKRIVKLFYQKGTKELTIKDIMTVSSKTFDVLDCLRSLEQRQLITKLENGNYRLMG